MHTPETRARAYAKVKARRIKWFKENGPCKYCGSNRRLELDHIDPKTKIDHDVWSWSEQRRELELKKCQVLCYKCHKKKTQIDVHNILFGRRYPREGTPTNKEVLEYIKLRNAGWSFCAIGKKFGRYHTVITENIRKYCLGSSSGRAFAL